MASPSSSSSITHRAKYDVFLSFRGEDTRDNFTSHLHAALCRKQLQTFIDDDKLKRGDEISPALINVIEESKISVVIFSKNYACSRWCLNELVKILECRQMKGQIVMPVFYQVDPSDVRKQSGSFNNAFAKHDPSDVEKWKTALTEAANLSGWHSTTVRPESKLVEGIVNDILKKLNDMSSSSDSEGLVRIDSRIKQIKSLLSEFQVVGIWGIGGIGKTTLAEAIYNQISGQFEGHCFIVNVSEELQRSNGLFHLRHKIISRILGDENFIIDSVNAISPFLKARLQYKKVLIVLDDVNISNHLEVLSKGIDGFGPGSRVIITARDKQLLYNFGVHRIYEVERLDYSEALKLFCNYAFKKNHPPKDVVELVNKIVDYAQGIPLVLKVLGSSLYQKSKQDWESTLCNLNMIGDPQIYDVLKPSYHALNWKTKSIFLDIACFFNGENKDYVTMLLDSCYNCSTQYWLSVLIDKALLTVSHNKVLKMRDLLEEMGRSIVVQESEAKPGNRSRLWCHTDIYHILKHNKGTDAVQGIFLNMSEIRNLQLSSRAFAKMSNLRLLKFYNSRCNYKLYKKLEDISKVHPRGLKYLSDELRYLQWDGYPLRTLPSKFSLENLVELKLPFSNIEQLWNGKKCPSKLKYINLRSSESLIELPDLSDAVDLEVINLNYCRSLVDVHSSVQSLHNLHTLSLRYCENLKSFGDDIHFRCPIVIDFSNCINLNKFPQISGNVVILNLSGTAIEEVPTSIACLSQLFILNMENCRRIRNLPTSICKLKSLTELILSDCSQLESFPEILEEMEGLKSLKLNGAATIKELPSSIEYLKGLRSLDLKDCINLETVPRSIGNLTSISYIDISGCSKLEDFPENLEKLTHLESLYARRTTLSKLPSFTACWNKISELYLAFCNLMELPEDLCCASSLSYLDLRGNNFETLPKSFKQLSRLEQLFLCNCNMLRSLPELPLSLSYLEAINCKQLQSLPELPSSLEKIDASELEKLPLNIFFIFTNCHNLDESVSNVLASAPLRFQHMAAAQDDKQTRGLRFCLPGSELPNWVHYQSWGSLLTFELPQNWCNKSFIGFSICAVIAFNGSFETRDLHVRCGCLFETTYGDKVDFSCNFIAILDSFQYDPDHMVSIYTDHVVCGIFYDAKMPRLLKGDHTAATFEFGSDYDWTSRFWKVKCCGVCPLYTQDNEAKCIATTIADLADTEENRSVMTMTVQSDGEEVEPKPKRICTNQIIFS